MQIGTDWSTLKSFATSRGVSIQYVQTPDTYYIFAIDGPAEVACQITIESSANTDQSDFETNFKTNANKPLLPTLTTVTTQTEKRDKTVKLASAKASVGSDSTATILIKIPGTFGSADGRWIEGGMAWFDSVHPDDRMLSVTFTDEDNLLGYGAGFIVGSYTDFDMPADFQGWRVPPLQGFDVVSAIGGYGFAPAGFYLKIVGQKGGGITTGSLYINMSWAKVES